MLRVPLSALYREGRDWRVFRDDAGRARATAVRVGHDNGLEVEVLEGLKPGDRVVVHPSDRVDDGASIVERQLR